MNRSSEVLRPIVKCSLLGGVRRSRGGFESECGVGSRGCTLLLKSCTLVFFFVDGTRTSCGASQKMRIIAVFPASPSIFKNTPQVSHFCQVVRPLKNKSFPYSFYALCLAFGSVHCPGLCSACPLEETVSVLSPRGQGAGRRLLTLPYVPSAVVRWGTLPTMLHSKSLRGSGPWHQHLGPPTACNLWLFLNSNVMKPLTQPQADNMPKIL